MIKTQELIQWYENKRHYFKTFLFNSEQNKFLLELIGLENKITENEILKLNSIDELENYIKIIFDREIQELFKSKKRTRTSSIA
ncbi:hypothetical protein [Marinitoga sp. 1155]|uniref:hypothetical protein n=1 Tax=Marinitoga sp. 1155 TaxID=1428448 RepID=UPI0006417C9E|nr:hypothetical protein [Marinitoga sp. 1155]KLO21902.1 hypothetical protein X274_09515 [Marinitoga sp. 1155]